MCEITSDSNSKTNCVSMTSTDNTNAVGDIVVNDELNFNPYYKYTLLYKYIFRYSNKYDNVPLLLPLTVFKHISIGTYPLYRICKQLKRVSTTDLKEVDTRTT
jgi:hypothetical protein